MRAVIAVAAGLLTGILSGFGIGGGSLLLLYLTLFAGVDQYQAGGINLLYFIACAPAALYSHIKNGLVQIHASEYWLDFITGAVILLALLVNLIQLRKKGRC